MIRFWLVLTTTQAWLIVKLFRVEVRIGVRKGKCEGVSCDVTVRIRSYGMRCVLEK